MLIPVKICLTEANKAVASQAAIYWHRVQNFLLLLLTCLLWIS